MTRSSGDESPLLQGDQDREVEAFLNAELDNIFGATFSAVIAHELRERYSSTLYETFRSGPAETRAALKSIFVSQRAVSVILRTLLENVRDAESTSEGATLLPLLESLQTADEA